MAHFLHRQDQHAQPQEYDNRAYGNNAGKYTDGHGDTTTHEQHRGHHLFGGNHHDHHQQQDTTHHHGGGGFFGHHNNPYGDRQRLDNVQHHLRKKCLFTAIALLLIAIVHCATFWVYYWWSILLIGFSFFFSIMGILHFNSDDSMQRKHCCFSPAHMIHLWPAFGTSIIFMGAVSFFVALLVTVVLSDYGVVYFTLGIIAMVVSILYVADGIAMVKTGRDLGRAVVERNAHGVPVIVMW